MKKLIFIITSLLIISSCAVKYQRPEIDTETLVRGVETQDSIFDVALIDWREFYRDPLLQDLIDSALVNNFDMKIALSRLEQASSYFKQSKTSLFPSLNATAAGGYLKADLSSTPSSYFTLGMDLSWEADIWGRLSSAKRGKYQELLGQKNTINAIQTKLIASVAQAYYTLVILDAEKQFITETIKNREEYLITVKELKQAAQTTEIAVLQAEAQLLTAKGYLPTINNAIFETENAISMMLGKNPGTISRSSVSQLDTNSFPNLENVGIPANLLRNRPDVLASENALRGALENFNSAKAAMYPRLTLTGNISSDAAQISQWFTMPGSLVYGILGGLTQPIINGRKLKTQKEVAYQEYQIAAYSFQESVLEAGIEVSNTLSSLNANKEKVSYMNKQFIALDKAYDYSIKLLINGYATYLDVLSAQEGMFNSKINLLMGIQECLNDNITLYRALGGGWNTFGLDLVETMSEYKSSIKEDPDNELIDLEKYIPGIVLDIRYATENNFTKTKIYTQPKAYLRKPAAEALKRAQEELNKIGLGFKVYDAYRPYAATKYFYTVYHDTDFVADPRYGSIHNKGCAVDVSLVDLKTGEELQMPTPFDEFTDRARHTYNDLPQEALKNRAKLVEIMEKHGFNLLKSEWWHYNYHERSKYKLMNISFEELEK